MIVLPREHRWLVRILNIRKAEHLLVGVKENLEQKLGVNRQLHVSRQLVKIIQIFILEQCRKFVVCPPVVEEFFNLVLKLQV